MLGVYVASAGFFLGAYWVFDRLRGRGTGGDFQVGAALATGNRDAGGGVGGIATVSAHWTF